MFTKIKNCFSKLKEKGQQKYIEAQAGLSTNEGGVDAFVAVGVLIVAVIVIGAIVLAATDTQISDIFKTVGEKITSMFSSAPAA